MPISTAGSGRCWRWNMSRANRLGIANYAIHGPRASGAIEKTTVVTVGRRLKAQGTSWYRL